MVDDFAANSTAFIYTVLCRGYRRQGLNLVNLRRSRLLATLAAQRHQSGLRRDLMKRTVGGRPPV